MPEIMITAQVIQRDHYREIRKAYHGSGNLQLSRAKQHLRRPANQLPKFRDRTIDDVTQAVFANDQFREVDDLPLETEDATNVETDPVQLEADEIIRQAEWYNHDTETKFNYILASKGYMVAGYQRQISDEQFIVKVDSCTCRTGMPCVHYYVTRDYGFDKKMSRQELVDMIENRNKAAAAPTGRTRRGDLGGKTPQKRHHEDPAYPPVTPSKRGTGRLPTLESLIGRRDGPRTPRSRPGSRPQTPNQSRRGSRQTTPTQSQRPGVLRTRSLSQQPPPRRNISFAPDKMMEIAEEDEQDRDRHVPSTQAIHDPNQWKIVDEVIPDDIDLSQLQHPLDLERTVQVLRTQPNTNMPQLDNYIGKYIAKGKDNVALVKADGQRTALILYKESAYDELPQLQYLAGKLVRNARHFESKTKKSHVLMRHVPIKDEMFDAQSKRTMETITAKHGGKTYKISMDCICDHPRVTTAEMAPLDLVCDSCKESFHSQCFPILPQGSSPGSFTCPPCNMTSCTKGAVWSERNEQHQSIANTCPIDGALTQLVIHEQTTNTRLQRFFPEDLRHYAVNDAINHLMIKDSYRAQKTMYDMMVTENERWRDTAQYKSVKPKYDEVLAKNEEIKKFNKKKGNKRKKKEHPLPNLHFPFPELTKNDMFGDPSYYWENSTITGARMVFDQDCPKCHLNDYPTHKTQQTAKSINLSEVRDGQSVGEFITEKFEDHTVLGGCPNGKECENVDFQVSGLKPQADKHWLVNVDVSSLKTQHRNRYKQDLVNCIIPNTVTMNNTVYKLGHATFNKGLTHFVSLHYDDRTHKMVYYDSMMNKDKEQSRFRIATYGQIEHMTPSSLSYIRTNYKKGELPQFSQEKTQGASNWN